MSRIEIIYLLHRAEQLIRLYIIQYVVVRCVQTYRIACGVQPVTFFTARTGAAAQRLRPTSTLSKVHMDRAVSWSVNRTRVVTIANVRYDKLWSNLGRDLYCEMMYAPNETASMFTIITTFDVWDKAPFNGAIYRRYTRAAQLLRFHSTGPDCP